MSPRVLKLLEILRDFKPDDNFVILGGATTGSGLSASDDVMSDAGSDNRNESDDDSLELSDVEEDGEDEVIDDMTSVQGRRVRAQQERRMNHRNAVKLCKPVPKQQVQYVAVKKVWVF